ncbi:MAG: hypothetical protein O2890_00150 [Cyanobacteria bacterium]|nr:hypothetical protein [Cyanobacteriota bacterium]
MSQSPQIIHLNILDTDYAKIAAGETIASDRKHRLAWGDATFDRLGKQIARYRYDALEQEGRDDLLCKIGSVAELFTLSDREDFDDRIRTTGRFYLTPGERQQVVNWLRDELAVDLHQVPES